jgi:hypothetical protein
MGTPKRTRIESKREGAQRVVEIARDGVAMQAEPDG